MADKKISQLTTLTGVNVDDANDKIAIVDTSAAETKSITRQELFTSVAQISVDGNITVGGLVDGRDVAADGTKLDGIEAGATADQTKADIDALGINAATLGSYSASYFTDYTDTSIANLVDTAPSTLDTLNELAAALGDDPNFATTISTQIGLKLDASAYTASDVLSKLLTVDGSGSGLDADLLDGQHGSYYYSPANAPDPVITLTGAVTGSGTMTNLGNVSIATTATADPTLTINGDASGSATFTNLGNATLTLTVADDSHNHVIANVDGLQTALDAKWGKGADIPSGADLNSYTSDGYYHQNTNTGAATGSNYPEAAAGMLEVTSDGSMVYQRYTVYNSAHTVYVRTYYNGTWYSWATQWDSLNDGSGSGLDADLLDGQHGSYYLAANSGIATNLSLVGTPVEDIYALSGTTPSLEPDNGSIQTWTLTGNSTPTDGFSAGQAITLMINDGTAYTITWPTMTWVNNGGTAPTLATSGYTVVALWKVSTTLYGALVGDGS
jgi:hypothetical protein